ncbi:MAG: protein translocase subunit SecD [Patescibacteria group bacterium]|nr:protein translocase subunit SecD [Patescibacteria group bacterium]
MKNRRLLFWSILLIALVSLLIDLPTSYRLKFKIGSFNFDQEISRPFAFLRRFKLVKGLDLAGGVHLMFRAKMEDVGQEDRDRALISLRDNIERRVNLFGVSEAVIQTSRAADQYRLIVELPGVVDVEEAIDLVGKTAQLDFRESVEIPPEATESATIYDLFAGKTGLTGAHLVRGEVQFNPNTGKPEVGLEFNEEGKKLFGEITKRNVEKPLAIFLDGLLVSAPQVKEPITDGKAAISGEFDLRQAKSLVSQLNAGSLPVSIELIERRQVGPTLGEESVQKSMRAGLVGLAIVALFMAIYYRWLGILADVGLVIYALISLAVYKLIPVTLTLPGLTGFLLSVGMAVDSNILIFERMKEELKQGKPWNVAMELGFGRAWDSIRDANVCTLIICFLLFNPFDWGFLNNSAMVRGFAVTLFLGVFISMFTGIIVARTLLRVFARKKA